MGLVESNFFKLERAVFSFEIWDDQKPFILTRLFFFFPHHRIPINGENPKHRSWHTLTPIADDTLFLFGGLSADNIPLSKLKFSLQLISYSFYLSVFDTMVSFFWFYSLPLSPTMWSHQELEGPFAFVPLPLFRVSCYLGVGKGSSWT